MTRDGLATRWSEANRCRNVLITQISRRNCILYVTDNIDMAAIATPWKNSRQVPTQKKKSAVKFHHTKAWRTAAGSDTHKRGIDASHHHCTMRDRMGHAEPHGSCRTVQGVVLPCWMHINREPRGDAQGRISLPWDSQWRNFSTLLPARPHTVVVWLHGWREEIQRIE